MHKFPSFFAAVKSFRLVARCRAAAWPGAHPNGVDGPELYYWQREGGRPGEIDLLLQANGRIISVELKTGAAVSMKSLHQFMFEKKLNFALRFDQYPPSDMRLEVKATRGNPVRYHLRSLPLYCAAFCGVYIPA